MNTGNLFFCACFDHVLPCIFLRKSHVVFEFYEKREIASVIQVRAAQRLARRISSLRNVDVAVLRLLQRNAVSQ